MTLEPPAGLPVDEEHGVYRALLLRWDEPAAEFGEDPGRVFRFGDVLQPKVAESCAVNFDHDRRDEAGVVVATVTDRAGLWASVKLGDQARRLVARGHRAVSVEVDNGVLSGVALVTARGNESVYPSARLLVDGCVAPPVLSLSSGSFLVDVMHEADVSGGRLLVDPQPVPKPAGWDLSGPPLLLDGGRARQEAYAVSISAVADDVAHDQAMYEQRMAAFREVEAEHEERMLIASGTPTHLWPAHTDGYRRWKVFEDQREAEREAEARRRECAGISELVDRWHARELVPAVETTERRASWWSRLLRRPR